MDMGEDGTMKFKFIGAVLTVLACGGVGLRVALTHKKEVSTLKQLICAIEYMACEIQYRLTPLPQLCRQAALQCSGVVNTIFSAFANELDKQITANSELCMKSALNQLEKHFDVPNCTREGMLLLGHCLGRFDLTGQLKDLEHVRQECLEKLAKLSQNQDARLRTYQTLSLCAGAALVIIFM